MSTEFLQRGLKVLAHVAGNETVVDIAEARKRAAIATDIQDQKSFAEWFVDPSSYLILQDWIPRDAGIAQKWMSNTEKYFPYSNILDFINDEENDPHFYDDLVKLRAAIEATGFDPDQNVTTTNRRLDHLILFGCGDGLFAKELIERLNPTVLTVVVTEWEDWVSSFWSIDWGTIWNQRCTNPDQSIYVLKADDANSLAVYLADANLPLLEHAACYKSPACAPSLVRLHTKFDSELIKRLVLYTGFVMDEYNMIWNSWHGLLRKPRVFHAPSMSITEKLPCIVIGSGPSLDDSLPVLSELSKTHIVISCASNYGTLRRYGIDVDILCLLERGDFMIDQYREVVDLYGAGATRLLASVTTPAMLYSLFHDSMVYFRPALTPLAIFAESPQQVLVNEGPQSINTGVALAAALGATTILLVGVDLGISDPRKVRSLGAIGESPRDFPLACPGNLVDTAYTNSMLVDGKVSVESVAQRLLAQGCLLYNASNGIMIDGFEPLPIDSYLKSHPVSEDASLLHQQSKDKLWDWWHRQPSYQPDRFIAMWASSRPRQHTHRLIQELKEAFSSRDAWIPHVCARVSELLKCSSVTRSQQFPRRIIRGQILKLMQAITRQLIVMAEAPEQAHQFEQAARIIVGRRLVSLEYEIYDLLDALEGLDAA